MNRIVCSIPGFLAFVMLAGCHEPQQPASSTQAAGGDAARIVSLSPAISRTLRDLGLADRIVGRSRFCDSIDPAIPVIGDLNTIDFETLLRVEPTHIFIQPPSTGLDPALPDLAAEEGWVVEAVELNGIDDVAAFVSEVPAVIGPLQSKQQREATEARAATLADALNGLDEPSSAPTWKGSVLVVAGSEGVLAFAEGTWLDAMVEALGAANLAPGRGWVELTLEDVLRLDPHGLIVVAPGSDAPRRAAAGELGELDIRAVRDGRIGVVRHDDALLPATSMIEVRDELRAILEGW